MFKPRLRTKFLLSLLFISSSLTCATLYIVRRSVHHQLLIQIADDLRNSISVFRDFQQQREINLTQSAELLANLPSLKALMTTHDAPTIQDASDKFWKLAPSDVFVLADPAGRIEAIHTNISGISRDLAQELLAASLQHQQSGYWWYGGGKLYEVFLQPIYFGEIANGSVLGILGVGHEISVSLARQLGRVVSSDVAFSYGDRLVVSTLKSLGASNLPDLSNTPGEVRLGSETFLARTVQLMPSDVVPPVHLTVFKSYDKAAAFLDRLNSLLIALGVLSIMAGSGLVFLISYTFTKPLATLVDGVRALGKGDFAYPLINSSGGDEVAELTEAFARMRHNFRCMQQDLLRAERLATIGQMAAFVSHDLRHPLTAVLANAEFLCLPDLDSSQRDELYWEIRRAVEQMTELIESLLEFSHSRKSLQCTFNDLQDTVESAIQIATSRPEFQHIRIVVSCDVRCETLFDRRKVERVLVNVLLNACEFVSPESGLIQVNLSELIDAIEIRVEDNGRGIAEDIRERLFQPFVSHGKQNGIGLGLTIARKILQDHGGDIRLEMTQPGRTIFKLTIPKEVCVELRDSGAVVMEDHSRSGDLDDRRFTSDGTDARRIFPAAS
jgi:signal transduction histidine kinase